MRNLDLRQPGNQGNDYFKRIEETPETIGNRQEKREPHGFLIRPEVEDQQQDIAGRFCRRGGIVRSQNGYAQQQEKRGKFADHGYVKSVCKRRQRSLKAPTAEDYLKI